MQSCKILSKAAGSYKFDLPVVAAGAIHGAAITGADGKDFPCPFMNLASKDEPANQVSCTDSYLIFRKRNDGWCRLNLRKLYPKRLNPNLTIKSIHFSTVSVSFSTT